MLDQIERTRRSLAAAAASDLRHDGADMRAAPPLMKAEGWGRIVNISSPFKSAYVAAKHGILGLTKAVALEVAEAGIALPIEGGWTAQ